MDKELIDRQEVLKIVNSLGCFANPHCPDDRIKRIKELPTVDAVPVVHGRWVDNHCTVCGMMPMGEELWTHMDIEPPKMERFMDYCPTCGAKMDGERSEGE